MTEYTDLALDIAELCDRLNVQTGEPGDVFLANAFAVEAWSSEFFQIIFSIINRTIALEALLKSTRANQAVLDGASAHLAQVRLAFDKSSLASNWANRGRNLIGPAHSSPIYAVGGVAS